MSHITNRDPSDVITNMKALERAVSSCHPNLVFNAGQTKYSAYQARLHDCLHAISIRNEARRDKFDAYEIGVIKHPTVEGGMSLACDFYGGAIARHAGDDLDNLMMAYKLEEAVGHAAELGYTTERITAADGWTELHIDAGQAAGISL